MDKLVIKGPAQLSGSVRVSSSKNASLPILAACILSGEEIKIKNLPKLVDVSTMIKMLQSLGMKIRKESLENEDGENTIFNGGDLNVFEATYDWVKTMRASILVLGPLLARFGRGKVSLPGGCAIGARPIDMHLTGFEKMGAQIDLKAGYVEAKVTKLQGAKILLPFPSVGATENIMMAAVLAKGTTFIQNAAQEPEIDDLAYFLSKMGAKIYGSGTSEIEIEGVSELKGIDHFEVIGDRIEAATYLIAAIMTNSEITIENFNSHHLESILEILQKMGANFELKGNSLQVKKRNHLSGAHIDTAPYPGFPTDVQAQLMALTTIAQSPSVITEHIFENRFMHVPELNRMGAEIVLKGNSCFIPGQMKLTPAPVMCTDLRASAALVLAALMADGVTEISRVYHLDRGYESLDLKLRQLGVDISRLKGK